MGFLEFVFGLIFIGIVGDTVVKVAGAKRQSKAITALESEVDELRNALADAENAVNGHATQLAEIQERLDFAERLLAQQRQKPALPGS
jgi:hypothetical protein